MMQVVNAQEVSKEKMEGECSILDLASRHLAIVDHHPTTQLISSSRFILHHPNAGLNPLVDAAAKLFSILGKLRYIKSYDYLNELHQELVLDIQQFQDTVSTYSYPVDQLTEYLSISTYLICASLNDLITHTPWGNQGKWDQYCLLSSFGLERLSKQNLLIVLERFIRDPHIYIDIMEFVYICFSLGFKGHFNTSEGDQEQLQQITYSLYKRIRSYRGNFIKTLSPSPIKPKSTIVAFHWKDVPLGLIILALIAMCLLFFLIGNYLLDLTFHPSFSTLNQAERTLNEKYHE